MKRRNVVVPFSLAAVLLLGCPAKQPAEDAADGSGVAETAPAAAAVDPRVQRAAEVSAALDARPGEEAAVLAGFELTIEGFESAMAEIAADATLSAQFRQLRGTP